MNANISDAKRFQALVPYKYKHDGTEKNGWTRVGVAFQSKDGDGLNVEIRPGLSVTGRLILRPFSQYDQELLASVESSTTTRRVDDPGLAEDEDFI